jgi:hypothetical protein
MSNEYILNRLEGIHIMLKGAHNAGKNLSSSTKGYERDQFIKLFLSQIFPPTFRFGSGDVTDKYGNRSGQLDIVIEFPFLPSIPIIGVDSSRLYMAEGIAAVLEIKSNIKTQWDQVKKTASKLAKVKRDQTHYINSINPPEDNIPFFAIGYEGWREIETIKKKLGKGINGILVINQGLFVSNSLAKNDYWSLFEAWSLWGLIYHLHKSLSSIFVASIDLFQDYHLGKCKL